MTTIACKNCHQSFTPDMKTRHEWVCPHCQAKNPNLKRHYRSVADLYILWLIFSFIAVTIRFHSDGLNFIVLFSLVFMVLLATAIVIVYKSKTPWADSRVQIIIWLAFGVSLLFRLLAILGMLISHQLNTAYLIGFSIPYTAIFLYLLWLQFQSNKYAVRD